MWLMHLIPHKRAIFTSVLLAHCRCWCITATCRSADSVTPLGESFRSLWQQPDGINTEFLFYSYKPATAAHQYKHFVWSKYRGCVRSTRIFMLIQTCVCTWEQALLWSSRVRQEKFSLGMDGADLEAIRQLVFAGFPTTRTWRGQTWQHLHRQTNTVTRVQVHVSEQDYSHKYWSKTIKPLLERCRKLNKWPTAPSSGLQCEHSFKSASFLISPISWTVIVSQVLPQMKICFLCDADEKFKQPESDLY